MKKDKGSPLLVQVICSHLRRQPGTVLCGLFFHHAFVRLIFCRTDCTSQESFTTTSMVLIDFNGVVPLEVLLAHNQDDVFFVP